MHYLITSGFNPFLLSNIRVYFEFASLFYSCVVIVVVLEHIVLLIALFSCFGYKFIKRLLTYLLTYPSPL